MLENKGLVKLVEECGELTQIAAKKMTQMDSDIHWDGKGSLAARLEDEIADVAAASAIVIENFNLNGNRIKERTQQKFELFKKWMDENNDEQR